MFCANVQRGKRTPSLPKIQSANTVVTGSNMVMTIIKHLNMLAAFYNLQPNPHMDGNNRPISEVENQRPAEVK